MNSYYQILQIQSDGSSIQIGTETDLTVPISTIIASNPMATSIELFNPLLGSNEIIWSAPKN